MLLRSLAVRSLAVIGFLLLAGGVWFCSTRRGVSESAAPVPPRSPTARPAEFSLPASLAEPPAGGPLTADAPPGAAPGADPDRRGVAPEAPARSAFRVVVKEENGPPLANAAVVLCPSAWSGDAFQEAPGVERRTDATGVARFGTLDEAFDEALDEILVLAPDHAPVRAVREGAEEQLIVVAGEVALAGVVLVDGEPAPGLQLSVHGFRDPSAGWSSAARFALRKRGLGESRLHCRTTASGEFALRGLPAGETVTLSAPDDFAPRDPDERDAGGVTARTIDTDVVLHLVRRPTLSGRPVRAEPVPQASSQPAPFGHVALVFRFEDVRGRVDESWASGSVGERFSTQLPFEPGELARLSVQLRTNWLGGELLAARTVEGPFAGSHDLGDITIGAGRTPLLLRVVERGAGPITGALALLSGRQSERTDARGEVTLERGPEDTRLLVGARGYELATLDLPAALPSPPAPLLVALEVANRLRIEVLPADGRTPLKGLQLALSIPLPMDDDTPEMHGEFASVRGAVPGGGIWSSDERTHIYDLDEGGVLELTDLPADVELGIDVRDRYEHTVAGETLVLRRGEHRTLPLRLATLPRAIEGRVVDEHGAPLPQAVATLGGFFEEARADVEGYFRLENVYAEDPTLSIDAEGYVMLDVTGWDALERSPFVLGSARTVWVEVLGADGARLAASVRLIVDGEDERGGTLRGDGLVQFDGVPLRPALVRAEAAGRTVEVPLDAHSTEVTARF